MLLQSIKKLFVSFWLDSNDYYLQLEINNLIISYKEILSAEDSTNQNQLRKISKPKKEILRSYLTGKIRLPSTLDLSTWGTVLKCTNNTNFTEMIISAKDSKEGEIYSIRKYPTYHEVEVQIDSLTKFKFKDTDFDGGCSNFTRIIDSKSTYIYREGKRILTKIVRKTKFMQTLNKDSIRDSRFITLDIETKLLEDGSMMPYCICICIPANIEMNNYAHSTLDKISFYVSTDYQNSDQMLEEAMKYLMQPKFSRYKVYVHNFSHFDAIFLFRIITKLTSKVKPIIRNSKIIVCRVYYGKNDKNYITFVDSYLLLPSSLRKLAQQFGVPQQKTVFPFAFVNKVTNLNYIGDCPKFEDFPRDSLTLQEYNDYIAQYLKEGQWNLRNESIKYCMEDCISLHQVIFKFGVEILDMFQYDISRSPTLPSLALGIYRSNFLQKEFKIPIITGHTYSDLVQGYLGGHVDVYYPVSDKNKKVYHYDVNSLYPYVMANFPMPVGTPIYFEGDICCRQLIQMHLASFLLQFKHQMIFFVQFY